jgi:hypothetical protein
MASSLVVIVLLVLSFSMVSNLFLTLRIIAILRSVSRLVRPPLTVAIGQPIPDFHGRILVEGRWIMSKELLGQAVVLVFLSGVCKQCRGKIPELSQIHPSAHRLGISFWIIGIESPRRVARLLKGSTLLENVLVLDPDTRRQLNPQRSAPFYLFIDDRGLAQASSFIGDENWQLFVEQLRESRPETQGNA